MIYLSFLRYLRIPWLNKHEGDWPANIFVLQKNRCAKVRTHPLSLTLRYHIQILSMIGFNLSPLPQRHGTATSNLSLAIGLLPLTLPKVLSPSARTGHSHMWSFPLLPDCSSYKTIWNLGDLEQKTVSLVLLWPENISPKRWRCPVIHLISKVI